MSRVYVLNAGTDYEGEMTLGVYSTQEAAFRAIADRWQGSSVQLLWSEAQCQCSSPNCIEAVGTPEMWPDSLVLHEVEEDGLLP